MSRGASYPYLVIATNPVAMRYQGFFSVGVDIGYAFTGYGSRVGVVCGAGLLKRNIGIVSKGASYSFVGNATYPEVVRFQGFFSVGADIGSAIAGYGSRVGVVCGVGVLKS